MRRLLTTLILASLAGCGHLHEHGSRRALRHGECKNEFMPCETPAAPSRVAAPAPQPTQQQPVAAPAPQQTVAQQPVIGQEVLLVPRTVYVPFAAQTPIAPVRMTSTTPVSAPQQPVSSPPPNAPVGNPPTTPPTYAPPTSVPPAYAPPCGPIACTPQESLQRQCVDICRKLEQLEQRLQDRNCAPAPRQPLFQFKRPWFSRSDNCQTPCDPCESGTCPCSPSTSPTGQPALTQQAVPEQTSQPMQQPMAPMPQPLPAPPAPGGPPVQPMNFSTTIPTPAQQGMPQVMPHGTTRTDTGVIVIR